VIKIERCAFRLVLLNIEGDKIKKDHEIHGLFRRAEDGTQTRDPQLGRLMLYRLSYFRNFSGQRWIRTTEGVSQQIYSLPHLATLVFAQRINNIFKERKTGLKPATLSLEG
jgi:hypothetical protein